MDDPNNAGIYKLNTICNDDPDIIPLLRTPAPCAFERDGNGMLQQIKDWKPENKEEHAMDILEQCQKWHEQGKHQKIIDALEAIPAEERTPEMDSELARAYNNLATPEDRELYQKALSLLKPHADYFAEDHCWNFRMGYSYYFLDQEGRALPYFRKALEKLPGDEDTQELIDDCERRITLPQFTACFRERTENWWETFAEMEGSLRQMMDDDKDHTRGAELVAQMEETLNLVFDEISFEMGFNGEKHELILTPVSPLRTPACAPRMAGTSPGRMCRSGWRSRVKTVSPSLPTAKSCYPCSGRRKAVSGGCSPPSPTRCWARSPICGTLTISMCWRSPRRSRPSPCPSCPIS